MDEAPQAHLATKFNPHCFFCDLKFSISSNIFHVVTHAPALLTSPTSYYIIILYYHLTVRILMFMFLKKNAKKCISHDLYVALCTGTWPLLTSTSLVSTASPQPSSPAPSRQAVVLSAAPPTTHILPLQAAHPRIIPIEVILIVPSATDFAMLAAPSTAPPTLS